jgi:cation diffusion facilitator CzcD-associated flavoprotein CzcO
MDQGVQHTVLERGSQIGHTWANLYDSLVLHTGRHLSSLPGLRFPAGTPLFPSRLDFLKYLTMYAATFRLPVETDVEVTRVSRANGHWIVQRRDGTSREARAVIFATGIVANPYTPELSGLKEFRGRVMHSVSYRRPEDAPGDHVLVAGTGNSAGEIAAELAARRTKVTLSVRTGATIVPRDIFGLPVHYLAVALSPLPQVAQRFAARRVSALSGLVRGKSPLPPAMPTACPKIPLIGLHLSDAIRAGRVEIRPGLAGFAGDDVCFSDGSRGAFDVVILATGYRAALGPIRDLIHLDECGFASRRDRVTSTDQPGVFFVGHTYRMSGAIFNIGRDARRAAGLVKTYLTN